VWKKKEEGRRSDFIGKDPSTATSTTLCSMSDLAKIGAYDKNGPHCDRLVRSVNSASKIQMDRFSKGMSKFTEASFNGGNQKEMSD